MILLLRDAIDVPREGGHCANAFVWVGSAARGIYARIGLWRLPALGCGHAALAAAARGERVVLGAFEGDDLIGTVTLLLSLPPNQPHRAEIAKLMTRTSHRGRGVATRLMLAVEELAVRCGRTLLVLDTAEDGGAAALYAKLGFILAGEIPDYALKPHGGLTGTLLFWKRIGSAGQTPIIANALKDFAQ